jgi:hypothetical protein
MKGEIPAATTDENTALPLEGAPLVRALMHFQASRWKLSVAGYQLPALTEELTVHSRQFTA